MDMKVKISVFACLPALLMLTTGCNAPNGGSGANAQAVSRGGKSSSNVGGEEGISSVGDDSKALSDRSEWTAYIDNARHLCIQKRRSQETGAGEGCGGGALRGGGMGVLFSQSG
nr:hypothetical protein [Oscillibacter sp.]